jgi:hypothetical protein
MASQALGGRRAASQKPRPGGEIGKVEKCVGDGHSVMLHAQAFFENCSLKYNARVR